MSPLILISVLACSSANPDTDGRNCGDTDCNFNATVVTLRDTSHLVLEREIRAKWAGNTATCTTDFRDVWCQEPEMSFDRGALVLRGGADEVTLRITREDGVVELDQTIPTPTTGGDGPCSCPANNEGQVRWPEGNEVDPVDTDTDSDTDTEPSEQVLVEQLATSSPAGSDSVSSSRAWAIATTPGAATVTAVELWMTGPGPSMGALRAELHADSGGVPSGTALGSGTRPSDAFSTTTATLVRIDLDTAVTTTAGTYWIVLQPDTGTGTWTATAYNTGISNQLAFRDLPSGTWTVYGKTYDWAHRVYGY